MSRVFLWGDECREHKNKNPFDIFAKDVPLGVSIFRKSTIYEKEKEPAELMAEIFEAKLSDCFEKRFEDSKAIWYVNEAGNLCRRERFPDGRLELCIYRVWDEAKPEKDLWTFRDYLYRGHFCDGLMNFFTKPLGSMCMEAFKMDREVAA